MLYHKGLIHQRGHGWGALVKTLAPYAVPMIGQVVGGLLGGAPQTGPSYQGHPQTGGWMSKAEYRERLRQRFKNKRKSLFGDPKKFINTYLNVGMAFAKPKDYVSQEGKGFFTDLLKSGAKSALTAAAKTGLDVLENKRSLKDALRSHGAQALKETAAYAMPKIKKKLRSRQGEGTFTKMAKRGASKAMKAGVRTGLDVLENKRSLKQALRTHGKQALASTIRGKKKPIKKPVKKPILARGGPRKIPPSKKKRSLDIFD